MLTAADPDPAVDPAPSACSAAQLALVAGGGARVHIALDLPLPPALAKQPTAADEGPAALAPLRALRAAARALLAEQLLPAVLKPSPQFEPGSQAAAQLTESEARAMYGTPAAAGAAAAGAPFPGARLERWSLAHDVALAALLDEVESAARLRAFGGAFTHEERVAALQAALRERGALPAYEKLVGYTPAVLAARAGAHDAFAALLRAALPLLPLGVPPCGDGGGDEQGEGPTAEMLLPLMPLVRRSCHARLVKRERRRGQGSIATPDVSLDRRVGAGVSRPPLLQQAADALLRHGGALFRPSGDEPRRWWHVSRFAGEAGVDGGGLYRDSVSCLADELQGLTSAPLVPPLLIPAPNSVAGVGTRGADAVLAPGEVGASDASLLRFVGRLMAGCALAPHGGEHLAVSLTPFTWAHLAAGAPPDSLAAFRSVDEHFVDTMEGMLGFNDLGNQAAFEALFGDQPACVIRSDGTEVALTGADGAPLVPAAANRRAFVAAATAARLAESAPAAAALRAGMLDVMPPQLLALWQPAALELAVCGDPEISVEELKRCTTCDLHGANLDAFWGAVELMTHRQRSDLLRYATGRQRLPVSLQVTPLGVDGTMLAKAATCSSRLYLPDYRTPQQALEKLLKTFELCMLAFENA